MYSEFLITLLPVLASAAPYIPYAPVASPSPLSIPAAPENEALSDYDSGYSHGSGPGHGGEDGGHGGFPPSPSASAAPEDVTKMIDPCETKTTTMASTADLSG